GDLRSSSHQRYVVLRAQVGRAIEMVVIGYVPSGAGLAAVLLLVGVTTLAIHLVMLRPRWEPKLVGAPNLAASSLHTAGETAVESRSYLRLSSITCGQSAVSLERAAR